MRRYLLVFPVIFLCMTGSAQEFSKYIVVDQFGYLPDSKKMAVIRDPHVGFDAAESFAPGSQYALVEGSTGEQVLTASPIAWKSGTTNASSGDKAWWFDFSSITREGTYYVLDITNNVRSFEFQIAENVYNEILRHAVRTFFYQRAGFPKDLPYADAPWADAASHVGNLQDANCRLYNRKTDASTERDLSGGWYDAGDYNKYTSWTANYVTDMMHAYIENPAAWGDDLNIPESGNGIPDLLDEAKWGIEHLLRMQNSDGSVLSIVGLAHASPPSSATGASYYGSASTAATLNTAGALAFASKVYSAIGMNDFAVTLKDAAVAAWNWADENPDVLFYNNDSNYGTSGLGAGQQEVDDYGRLVAKIEAAVFLFDLTGEISYRDFVDTNYGEVHLIAWNYAYAFESSNQDFLLYYAHLPNATASVADKIKTSYKNSMNSSEDNFPAATSSKDPYLAHLQVYTWGSNGIKGAQGSMFYHYLTYDLDEGKSEIARHAAEGFIHYIHGVNPLNMTYLSNMYSYGGDNGVNEFYHSWFADGNPKWDRVGTSTYGPAPGFLVGGPNPSYDWDGCCPNGCGSTANNSVCTSIEINPPKGQPEQKSYLDFNTSWPLNSWSVTENSNGYQINYIRLLSKFVDASYDCSGTKNGTASFDVCGVCSGGTTGAEPETDPNACNGPELGFEATLKNFRIYPNPASTRLTIENHELKILQFQIMDLSGRVIASQTGSGPDIEVDIETLPSGQYMILICDLSGRSSTQKFIKR